MNGVKLTKLAGISAALACSARLVTPVFAEEAYLATAPPVCDPIPGLSRLMDASKPRFVIFGEIHGTLEIPRLFFDAVCQLSVGRTVVVALEFGTQDADAIQLYVSGTGSITGGAITSRGAWTDDDRDGRTSAAMFELIQRLRQLRLTGRSIEVAGIIPEDPGDLPQSYYELGMANHLRIAATHHPDAIIVALVGNIHARKTSMAGLRPAASFLPSQDVRALLNDSSGGNVWNCRGDRCGVYPMSNAPIKDRGITTNLQHRSGYDGSYSVGRPYTASPPIKAVP